MIGAIHQNRSRIARVVTSRTQAAVGFERPRLTARAVILPGSDLDRLVRGDATPQQLAPRGRILLCAAEGAGASPAYGRRRCGKGASSGGRRRANKRSVSERLPMRRFFQFSRQRPLKLHMISRDFGLGNQTRGRTLAYQLYRDQGDPSAAEKRRRCAMRSGDALRDFTEIGEAQTDFGHSSPMTPPNPTQIFAMSRIVVDAHASR